QIGKTRAKSFDRAGGILIGANFERIFFFEFQQRRNFLERFGNLFLRRHDWQDGNFRVKFALRKMVRVRTTQQSAPSSRAKVEGSRCESFKISWRDPPTNAPDDHYIPPPFRYKTN